MEANKIEKKILDQIPYENLKVEAVMAKGVPRNKMIMDCAFK